MYLITVIKIHFDGHNEEETGFIYKFITENEWFTKLDPEGYYYGNAEELQYCENEEDFDECMEENISLPENIIGGENGYHTTRLQFTVREITKEEAKQMEIVIDTYNNL